MNSASTGIWLVREEARALGARLQLQLGGELFEPWHPTGQSQKELFRKLFPTKTHWVLVMATGIASRFLDGLPQDKHTDPAVVVLDEGGHFAIPLLSGHEGGANRLAYAVANCIGATPVITTATEAVKPLVAGIGCRKGVTADQVEQAVRHALQNLAIEDLREIATIDLKANEPGLLAFCGRRGLPLRVFASGIVAARPWVTQPSEWVRRVTGVDGVCEPCALLASPRGKLLVPKTTLNGVAVAVVEDRLRLT